MPLAPTTTRELETLFVDQILSTTPKILIGKGGEWKHHTRPTSKSARTRRFELVWGTGNYVSGGIFSNASVETDVELRVRADYAARAANNPHMVEADWHQLRDRLQLLTANAANGLILVLTSTLGVRPVAQDSDREDVARFDLTYQVRYLRARG